VVSTPDPVCVRSVSVAARQALRLGCRDVRLLINRFDRRRVLHGQMMMLDDIIDLTEAQLIGVIPQQTKLFGQTKDGLPLQDSLVTQAAARIAARLDGENVPLVIPSAE
jgi:septum formation inhibitor-activating ATPase MinD